jgi:microcystin-dependent protein
MSEPFVGQITLYAFSFPPRNWADCAGQILPIQQYTALFSLLGTTYGGNGTTTFALPDLRGRAAVGIGEMAGGETYVLGEQVGAENAAVTPEMAPSHGHALAATSSWGTTNDPAGALLAQPAKGDLQGHAKGKIYNPGKPNAQLTTASVVPAGGQQPHNNMQPSLALRYCIALDGLFPARS